MQRVPLLHYVNAYIEFAERPQNILVETRLHQAWRAAFHG